MKFSKEEKWQVSIELEEELLAADPAQQEPLKSEIVTALERGWQHYLEHPETAVSPEKLSRRMKAQRKGQGQ